MVGLMDWFNETRSQPGVGGGLLGGKWNADDGKNDAIKQALLAAGLGLLSKRGGSFAQNLGQSGLQGMQAYTGQRQQQRQDSMQDWQMQQMKTDAERKARTDKQEELLRALPGQFMRPGGGSGMDPIGGVDTAVEAPNNVARPQGFDMPGYIQALMGIDPQKALSVQALMRKEAAPLMNVAPGASVFDPAKGAPVYTAPNKPEAEKMPEALRALALIYGEGSPEYSKAARNYAQKLTTHTPASSIVNYGSPVPMQLPDGSVGYAQPSNRGGPASAMVGSDGKPMVKPAEEKPLNEAQAKATAFLGQMRASSETLKQIKPNQANWSEQINVGLASTVGNAVASEKGQQTRQAQEQWAEALLRFKTGAVATESEVARNVRTYFPQLGDKPSLIAQKTRMREQAEADLAAVAGKGAAQAKVVPSIAGRTAQLGKLSAAEQAELEALRKQFPGR